MFTFVTEYVCGKYSRVLVFLFELYSCLISSPHLNTTRSACFKIINSVIRLDFKATHNLNLFVFFPCLFHLQISRNLGRMYSEMIFVNGFVHCDPHPGNVLVRKCPKSNKTEIVLLDHGLYQVRHRPSFGAHNKANPSHITAHYSLAASRLSEPPVLRPRKSISLETTCSSAMCFRTALLHTHTHTRRESAEPCPFLIPVQHVCGSCKCICEDNLVINMHY